MTTSKDILALLNYCMMVHSLFEYKKSHNKEMESVLTARLDEIWENLLIEDKDFINKNRKLLPSETYLGTDSFIEKVKNTFPQIQKQKMSLSDIGRKF